MVASGAGQALPSLMRLTRLFLLTTTVLLGLVSLMLVRATVADWRTLQAAEQGLAVMERTYLAMKVAEKASAERGPANVVLGDTQPPDPAKRARLEEFRRVTDQSFVDVLSALQGQHDANSTSARQELERARQQLEAAREELDRVAALPLAERNLATTNLTRRAVAGMFAVIDTLLGPVTTLSASAEAVYPELAMPLVGARYAAELREYAGRLGSQFAAPLAAQTPLSSLERHNIPVLVGRIEQLRKLITLQARVSRANVVQQAAIDTMQARYFDEAQPLVERLTEAGLAGKPYGIDAASFVARYVPPMKSIVEARDILFASAKEAAERRVEETEHRLWINAALGLSILCVEISVFLLIRRRVLVPVLRNTRAMVHVMQGKPTSFDGRPLSTRRDEIGDMERAVAALRDALQRSRHLEQERDQLVEQLREASNTDFLTGLPNHRAFAERAAALLGQARRHDWFVAVLLFRIDDFHRIHRRVGQLLADRALCLAADIARAEVREADLLARHRGEEFVILAPDASPDAARQLRDRLAEALRRACLQGEGGEVVQFSARFGLVCRPAREFQDQDRLLREAEATLQDAPSAAADRSAN